MRQSLGVESAVGDVARMAIGLESTVLHLKTLKTPMLL